MSGVDGMGGGHVSGGKYFLGDQSEINFVYPFSRRPISYDLGCTAFPPFPLSDRNLAKRFGEKDRQDAYMNPRKQGYGSNMRI